MAMILDGIETIESTASADETINTDIGSHINWHEGYAQHDLSHVWTIETPPSTIWDIAIARHKYHKESNYPSPNIYSTVKGLIGEFAVREYLGYHIPSHNAPYISLNLCYGPDPGWDMVLPYYDNLDGVHNSLALDGIKVDAKFCAHENGDLVFTDLEKFKADIAVLVVPVNTEATVQWLQTQASQPRGQLTQVRLAGWITREEFKVNAIHHPPFERDPDLREYETYGGFGMMQPNEYGEQSRRPCKDCQDHVGNIHSMDSIVRYLGHFCETNTNPNTTDFVIEG